MWEKVDTNSDANSNTYYYLFNAHGDVIQHINLSGEIKSYKYDAFGNEQSPDKLDSNPFRYCGEYFDRETGEIYLRARYYNPAIGRFGAEDSARSGLNWYTYCNNNPIIFYDPTGCVAYTQTAIGGYRYSSISREQELTFLVFNNLPYIGTVIDMTSELAFNLSGMKKIDSSSRGNDLYKGTEKSIMNANALLKSASDLKLTNILEDFPALGEASKLLGRFGNVLLISDVVSFQSDQQSDIIDEIIEKQFSSEMFSSSRDIMKYKYITAKQKLIKLIEDGKLEYSTNKMGGLKDYKFRLSDAKEISKTISSINKLSDSEIKKKLNAIEMK